MQTLVAVRVDRTTPMISPLVSPNPMSLVAVADEVAWLCCRDTNPLLPPPRPSKIRDLLPALEPGMTKGRLLSKEGEEMESADGYLDH